jgi:hypothetical protein
MVTPVLSRTVAKANLSSSSSLSSPRESVQEPSFPKRVWSHPVPPERGRGQVEERLLRGSEQPMLTGGEGGDGSGRSMRGRGALPPLCAPSRSTDTPHK